MQKQKAVQETPERLFLYGANAIKNPPKSYFGGFHIILLKITQQGKMRC